MSPPALAIAFPTAHARVSTSWPLGVILALFLFMGGVYSLVTPIFEASDERWHYPVVRHIVRTGQLPVQDPQKRTDWHQEGSQPPLYYLVAAALTAWIPTDDFRRVYVPNPHAVVGEPLVVGNKNMMVHSAHENWPWRGTTLAVHVIRLFSVALGGVTVWLTYRIARLVWPAEGRVALLAAALTAFNPMFLFISASVNNDNLAAPLAAAIMLVLLRVMQRGQRWRDGLWLGILLGLGAITKLSVLALLPLTLLVLLWEAWRGGHQGRSHAWRDGCLNLFLVLSLVALIAGWWYWRNWTLYGDPTGLNRMLDIAGRRKEALTWERLGYEFEGFRITYWALFGALNILVDRWIYTLLDGLSVVAIAGLLFTCIRLAVWEYRCKGGGSGSVSSVEPAALVLLIGWVVSVLVALLRWTSQTYATQGRLMFVAIAGISTLLAIGLLTIAPRRLRTAVAVMVGGGLCVLAMLSPLVYIAPAYARPPLLRAAHLPADIRRVDWTVGNVMRLVGYRLEPTAATRALPAVRPFESLPLTVYWEAVRPMDTHYSVFVHLLGRERHVIGQVNTYPGLGLWPTTQLQPGEVVADTYRVPVAADAAAPTLVRVHVGLYRYEEPGRPGLETRNAAGQRIEPWLTTVKLIPWEWPQVVPMHPLSVQLGEVIRLLGYDLVQVDITSRYILTLYWEALGRPAADYTVFIQVWDEARQVAGFDSRPLGGDYPTDWWEEGERIVDPHALELSHIPAGSYHLRVGMYRLDTGERLPAYDATGPLPDYAVRFEMIR